MDINNLVSEQDVAQQMWLLLAQLGVIIDNIDDDNNIYYTVPKSSPFMVRACMLIPGVDQMTGVKDEELSGELLIAIANSYFEDNGFTPHGGIRDQGWSDIAAQLRVQQEEMDIKKTEPELLRL